MDLTRPAWISIGIAGACAGAIAVDELRRPQKMSVMNVVWPVTALYFSVAGLWGYLRLGRAPAGPPAPGMPTHSGGGPSLAQAAVGTSHCGAGCMLADVACAFVLAATGAQLFGSPLVTEYIVDLAAAWVLGILFQYWAIRPMHRRDPARLVLMLAMRADTFSILAFQVGMYAWMAVVYYVLFPSPHLDAFDPRYWLMMQAGMVCGFATSLPMNRWLIGRGWKEAM